MSTEHQQYSTANQKDAIYAYAAAHDIEIVVTYEDAGRSGLTLAGRPSLRKLIADVVAGQNTFEMILVYDVSRWGRFQDADESAHLEYLCRLSGVRVEYCAEPFSNDGSPFSSICKVVKRALAAEYSRELSHKVYVGKRRLITLGFHQGASAGFGLRRCLVDASGVKKGLLSLGEYKSIATDRVILVPGPPDEVAIVRRIYREYTHLGMACTEIAASLNRRGVRSESGRPWSRSMVKCILTCEKYVGDNVWGRYSFKLKMDRYHNPPTAWARFPGAFEGIVSRRTFEKAQKVRLERAKRFTDEEIVAKLHIIYCKHGAITRRLIDEDGFLGGRRIAARFGSLITAYARAGYRPSRDLAFLSLDKTSRRLRDTTANAMEEGIVKSGGTVKRLRGACRFLVNGEVTVSVAVAQERRSQKRKPRWIVKRGGTVDDLTIAVLMDGPHERAKAYYFLPASELRYGLVLASRNPIDIDSFRSNRLEPIFRIFTRCLAATEDSLTNGSKRDIPHGPSQLPPPAPKEAMMRSRRRRSLSAKSYTGAFLRASDKMRRAIASADASHSRLRSLRETLAVLLLDARFAHVLASQGIGTVPQAALQISIEALEERRKEFDAWLRDQALALLSGSWSRRARILLSKLTPERSVEAAELMVLIGDPSEEQLRALVAASPLSGRTDRPRKHIYGASPEELEVITDESAYIYRETKRALAEFGHDTLDMLALEAFVRRLLALPRVVGWLERHDMKALGALKPKLKLFRSCV